MLIFVTTELAFPGPTVYDANNHPEVDQECQRWTIQGDHDLCEADNGPVSMAAQIQLACMPCKSEFFAHGVAPDLIPDFRMKQTSGFSWSWAWG